ncbi:hypothetical protein PoB_000115500 [Plakobranchus ocellatus]|uniref:Uncharacterized protein n=1 Tax=Plakobranchus ocellatus TaxID=259542 RepID=A0AAV3XW62_9GAST|nr:hypothetical protein PoB_000115500 [Plakobranchus ocellatus]
MPCPSLLNNLRTRELGWWRHYCCSRYCDHIDCCSFFSSCSDEEKKIRKKSHPAVHSIEKFGKAEEPRDDDGEIIDGTALHSDVSTVINKPQKQQRTIVYPVLKWAFAMRNDKTQRQQQHEVGKPGGAAELADVYSVENKQNTKVWNADGNVHIKTDSSLNCMGAITQTSIDNNNT